MTGFKKWLLEAEQVEAPPATVNLRAKPGTPQYNQNVTMDFPDHPVAGNGSGTLDFPAQKTQHYSFAYEIMSILEPVDPWLYSREANSLVSQGFQGTVDYAPPEALKRHKEPKLDTEHDTVEQLLKACAHLFPWMDHSISKVMKTWYNFRQTLQVGSTREAVNPVLYKVNLMRIEDCQKAFSDVDKAMKACKNPSKWGEMISKWDDFYPMWGKVVKGLEHNLVKFEKNAREREDNAYRAAERSRH